MMKQLMHCMGLVILTVFLSLGVAQAQMANTQANHVNGTAASPSGVSYTTLLAQARQALRSTFSLLPATRVPVGSGSSVSLIPAGTPNLPVFGGGTLGRLTKWTGFTSGNSSIGDTTIFESKYGLVGIGTDTPTSKLTVAGMIEITLGGLKFPDGSVQTTGGLASVSHDATLSGNGTPGTPLGVAVPLTLSGSVAFNNILAVQNNGESGQGVFAQGGFSNSGRGGAGVTTVGGNTADGIGGHGVFARGGLSGDGNSGFGVLGVGGNSDSGTAGKGVEAVGGDSNSSDGGLGVSAVGGDSNSGTGGTGVLAVGGFGSGGIGHAGAFAGNVQIGGNLNVTGTVSKGGGSFKIDHPLDPENKYLYHSFVESPDMMNIYNGNILTDDKGEAVVTLPDWFAALNHDFRYQLTVIGTFAQAIIAEKIKGNRFTIKTNAPKVEVSWQVTGIRQDAWAKAHRIPVEEEKVESERGYYLYPELYNQPEEKSIEWAHRPEFMQQLKQRRLEAEQRHQQKQPNQR